MRKIILGTVLGLVCSIGAYTSAKAGNGFCDESDPCGGWVKIDASGLVISGASVCTYSVCGDPSSLFNKLTLNAGEQWVQQTVADPVTGNVVGIGNNPGTTVTYDRPSETFTIVREEQPQPTSEPSAPSAPQQPTGVEPTSGPQPAPESTPAPPVVVAPTQTPEPVVPIIVPTVDPNVIPNTYEWKLSDNNGEFRWQPKRRSPFSGEQQAI